MTHRPVALARGSPDLPRDRRGPPPRKRTGILSLGRIAIEATRGHLARGDLTDGLVFDAVRMRFVEIGEAVGALPNEVLETGPTVPWREVVAMRHKLAHPYFDAAVGVLAATVADDLPTLEGAVRRMIERMG